MTLGTASAPVLLPESKVDWRRIDWIWNVSGAVALAPGQSNEDAFDRLEPLLREIGTSHERSGDTLTFQKKDPAAQDKLAVFDKGILHIEPCADGGAVIEPAEAGGVIQRSSEHLANIVDGLLDISRIESGVLKLNRDVVPLPAFLETLVEMFRMQAQAKGLRFDYHPARHLPAFVRTDEKRLRQILINLLSNAIKYTASGSIGFAVR